MTDTATHGTTIIEYPRGDRLHLAAIARVLGGAEPEPVADSTTGLTLYKFDSLTAALVFCEIVHGRDDVDATTNLLHFGVMWRLYVADRTPLQ